MDRDVYATVLKNTLDEIRNICPEVRCSFLFSQDNTIIASDTEAQEAVLEKTVESFSEIFERADVIGGLELLLVDGDKGITYLSRVSDMYLTIVAEAETDMRYLRTVIHVIIPTILKMVENIPPTPLKLAPLKESSVPTDKFTVEVMKGLFVRRDTVQMDPEILSKWSKDLEGKDISMVEIESSNGTTVKCKVKAISDPELRGKGITRVPDKICNELNVKNGETVKIKPLVS